MSSDFLNKITLSMDPINNENKTQYGSNEDTNTQQNIAIEDYSILDKVDKQSIQENNQATEEDPLINSSHYAPADDGEFFHKKEARCCSKTCKIIVAVIISVIMVALIALAIGLGLTFAKNNQQHTYLYNNNDNPTYILRDSSHSTPLGNYSAFAISVDGEPCAKIGRDVLMRNGTAVDAAIATLFCNGLINSHSMGIGGGFLMTIYVKKTGEYISLNAREAAPAASDPFMYKDNPKASQNGPMAAAVPGEIRGYWEAKEKYGNKNISWSSLIQPSINMCRYGIPVTFSAAQAMKNWEKDIRSDPGMRKIYINPLTNDTWKEGDLFKREKLAQTLEKIAKNGVDEFYTGETAQNLIQDLKDNGGILTMEDFKNYKIGWDKALKVDLGNHTLYSNPPPGSGSILAYILNILQHYNLTPSDDVPLTYHRIAESFKWAYAKRSQLGDPFDESIRDLVNELVSNMTSLQWGWEAFRKINDSYTVNNVSYYGGEFVTPNDHGTAHLSILAANGDAVSVTSTVNLYFGARFLSQSTGILINNEMDDFSYPTNPVNYFGLPPSPNNFVKPGKRPLSSMSPAIITNRNGDVQLVVGAAGGTKITTAVAFTIIKNLWLGKNIKESIDALRIHHQLAPMVLDYQTGMDENITSFLKSRKHQLKEDTIANSIVCGIEKDLNSGRIYANADFRKAGGVAGF